MNDKAALIEELHTICAYPDRAGELFAAMEKEQPEGLRWLEERLSVSYDARVQKMVKAAPVVYAELAKVEWDKAVVAPVREERSMNDG